MRKKSIDEDSIVTVAILRSTVRDLLQDLREEINNEIRDAILESERRTDEKARIYRDEVLTKMDGVMGELAQMREDKVFFDHDIKELKETSADHETRIIFLEERAH